MSDAVRDCLPTIDVGDGPVLLLLHGFPVDARLWKDQIPDLSQRYRVLAPTLRSYRSAKAAPPVLTVEEQAADVVRLLDSLGLPKPVTVCGLSMGGYVALALLDGSPDRVDRLILCDTKAAADSDAAKANREKVANEVLVDGLRPVAEKLPKSLLSKRTVSERPETVRSVGRMIAEAEPFNTAAAQRGMALRPDRTAFLAGIACPTLVVCGEDDAVTTPDEMRSMAERIPNAKFETIECAGHFSPLERPRRFNEIVSTFLGD